DFALGAEDPQGHACPLGSHIRRSNPRDSLGEDRDRGGESGCCRAGRRRGQAAVAGAAGPRRCSPCRAANG
ncbi:hypothetical protein EN849_33535, partial [Mesorhizobium sp. M2D.F.Ca.ET.206.01.1.1]